MKKFGKNAVAVGLVTLLITAAMSFSANGADDPAAQADAHAAEGTGLFQILDTEQCAAQFPDGKPTGTCGPGLNTSQIDAFSQTATAGVDGKNGVSSAKASVAPIDLTDLGAALDLSDLSLALSKATLKNVLGPVLRGGGGLLNQLNVLTNALDGLLRPLLDGLNDTIPISLQVGAVESSAEAAPGSASGDSTVAGVNLVIKLGPGQKIVAPLDLDTTPNSPLVVTAPQQLVNGILTGNKKGKTFTGDGGLDDSLNDSLGGALGPVAEALLKPLQTQILDEVLDALEPTLLQGLNDALKPLITGTVNKQVDGAGTPAGDVSTQAATGGEIEVTALELKVLGDDNQLDLAKVHVGPNGLVDDQADSDTDSNADTDTNADTQADADTNADTQADADTNADTQADADTNADTQADADTNADTQADADTNADAVADSDSDVDADAQADADVTSTLPSTGAPNLLPFWLLGAGLVLFGGGVLVNERRRQVAR